MVTQYIYIYIYIYIYNFNIKLRVPIFYTIAYIIYS